MSNQPFRILIAPLNWGLGHATRCLPIAKAFEGQDANEQAIEVHWASDGQALALLRTELPADTCIHELPSYSIRYPTGSASVNMVLGGPQMAAAIVQEAKAVAALHKQHNYSFILSDNRFGCRVDGVPSAILTHQVHLPIRNWFSRKLGNLLNQRLLAKFDQVVVPDMSALPRLAGSMSAPHPKVPTNYIGPVSRFSNHQTIALSTEIALAIVLSGPEPQRTKLEHKLLQQLSSLDFVGQVTLVRGRPSSAPELDTVALENIAQKGISLKVHDFLGTDGLLAVLAKADTLITRPGYTSVMDLSVLGRKAIYIPTPGQPEQEWLGKSLETSYMGICIAQKNLVLAKALEEFKKLRPAEEIAQLTGASLLEEWVAKVLGSV
ncbi:MAG: glycosyltransferase [Saprospiraceae bacterium]